MPPRDPKFPYYQEFCQLTIANMVMQTQIKKLLLERQEMLQRVQKVQVRKKDDDKPRNDSPAPSATPSSSLPAAAVPSESMTTSMAGFQSPATMMQGGVLMQKHVLPPRNDTI